MVADQIARSICRRCCRSTSKLIASAPHDHFIASPHGGVRMLDRVGALMVLVAIQTIRARDYICRPC